MLQEAYESGQLKGRQIIKAKRPLEIRRELGPSSKTVAKVSSLTSSYSLVSNYLKKGRPAAQDGTQSRTRPSAVLLVVQCLKKKFDHGNFTNLVSAKGLDTLPKCLVERIRALN
jgi:ParB family chromosome partitioning protein